MPTKAEFMSWYEAEKKRRNDHRKAIDFEERSAIHSRRERYYWQNRKRGGGRWTSC